MGRGAKLMVTLGCAVLAGPLAGGLPATAQEPAGETVWLCHPDRGSDPCSESLETTVQHRNGSSTVVDPPLARDPRADCFYVSDQPTRNADRSVDPQIEAIARLQANRFARRCAVYAPVYRQVTVPTLLTGSTAEQAACATPMSMSAPPGSTTGTTATGAAAPSCSSGTHRAPAC